MRSLADADQLRNAERGVAERAHRARLHPAIVHRPFADADLGEADLDAVAVLAAAGVRGCAWRCSSSVSCFSQSLHVEADDQIGVLERLLVHAQAQRMLVGKVERVVDVPHRGAGQSRPARRCSRSRRRAGRRIPAAASDARP